MFTMFSLAQGTKRSATFESLDGDWGTESLESAADRKRKKRSRWNQDQEDRTVIPGMPTVIPPGLNKDQEKQYIVHLQIEEISRKLRSGDLGIPPNPEDSFRDAVSYESCFPKLLQQSVAFSLGRERSPSPEPIYNNEGKRLNTREYRTRKKLEDERHRLVQEALALNPSFKPPADYKPPIVRVSDKVMIPQEEHPDINFVGLLIGPRGNTLKNLEKETGAKIIIRGKGSVKEGKIGRKDGQPLPGEDEPLHAYVTANNPENVKKAVEKIKEIIKQGIEVPEGQNDLRRQQLRELALLNGTLRENDGLAKLKQIAQAQTIVTNTIICSLCGGAGHIAQDCKERKPGDTFRLQQMPQSTTDRAKMDSEYMSLMAELGEGPTPKPTPTPTQPMHRPMMYQSQPPPNPMAFNPPWQQQQHPPPQQHQSQVGGPRPNFLPHNFQPPPGMMGGMPPFSQVGRMPLPPAPVSMPCNPASQIPPSVRPWQSPGMNPTLSNLIPNTSAPMGMPSGVPPPPTMMSAPPPPPPSTQPQAQSSMPWNMNLQPGTGLPHTHTQVPQAHMAPWQQNPALSASGVPPPPPWQQQQQNPPPPVPPPPPPQTGQQCFAPMVPPPPPPNTFDIGQMSNVTPMFVSPPPPPPPS